METKKNTTPLRTALTYAIFGGLWILLSDKILSMFVPHSLELYPLIQTVKGWMFIGISAILLYFILRKDLKALRESEVRHRQFFEASLDAALLTAPDGNILAANPAACRMFGRSEEELRLAGREGIVDLSDPRLKPALEERARSGRFMGELTFIHKNGMTFPVEIASSIYKNTDGHDRASIVIRDITERRQAEAALAKSEQRWTSLVKIMPDYVALFDMDGRYLFLNHYADGFSEKDVIGRLNIEFLPKETVSAYTKTFETAQKSGITQLFEYPGYGDNGEIRYYESSFTPIFENGDFANMMVLARDVTERRQAQEALIHGQQQMYSMIQEAPLCIAMFDREMRYIATSRLWMRENGNGFTDLIGRSHYEVHPEVPQRWREVHQRGLAGETINSDDDLLIHEDGRKEWLSWAVVPWHNAQGQIGGIILSTENTTERKLAEIALKASEERYRDLVENSLSLICTHDLEGNLLSVNEATVRLSGYSRDALLRMNLRDLLSPAGEEQLTAYIKEIKANRHAQGLMKVCLANGELHVWAYNNTLRTEGIEEPVVRGFARDITERKKAEDALLESEERFQKSFHSSPVGMAITHGRDGYYIDANNAFCQIIGFNREELIGQNSISLKIVTPEQRKSYQNSLKIEGHIHNQEMTLQHRSGKTCVVLGSMEVIELNHEDCVLSTAIDITERKQAQEQLHLQSAMLEAAANAIVITNREGQIEWANPAFTALTDYIVPDEVFGLNPRDLVKSGIQPKGFYKDLWDTILDGKVWRGELLNRRKDGILYHEEMTITPLRGEAGEIAHFIAVKQDITERKHAESALTRSEQAYRALFENMPIGLYRISSEGLLLDVNPALIKMFGCKGQEALLAKNIAEFYVDPANSEKFKKEMEKNATLSGFVAEYRRADRTTFWTEDHAHAVRDKKGAVLFYEGSLIDITGRRQMEEALSESKQLLQTIIDTSPMRIFWKDRELRYLGCNPAFAEDAGETHPKYLIGKDDHQLGWKAQADLYQADDKQVMESGIPKISYEEPQSTPKGKQIWLRTSKMPLRNKEKQVIGILGIYEDITEQKKAQEALLDSENKYRHLVQNMQVGVVVHAPDTRILLANPMASRLLGLTLDQLLGKTAIDPGWQFIREDGTPCPLEDYPVNQALATYLPITDLILGILLPGQKTPRWAQCNAHQIWETAGKIKQIVVTFMDITERKKAEEMISQYAVELEERVMERTMELVHANHVKDEFLANVSHELRTPLNGILGYSEMLLEGVQGSINERQSQAVEIIHSSGKHLLGLINDVLDVSKIEAGKFELRLEKVSVNSICQSSLVFIHQLAHKKSIAVEYSSSPSDPTIFADPMRLKQILVNLLNNAVKFTPDRGIVRLETWKDSEASLMWFSVTDNGIGIPPEDLKKLFEPFVQLDSSLSRQYEGTGLGLALVKKLVEMHGGSVHVESGTGNGSCFQFSIPIQTTSESSAGRSESPMQLATNETDTKPIRKKSRILLVEDNDVNLMVTSDYLNGKGYEVIEARNGYEASNHAHVRKPDLILMDIQMPGINGIEVIASMRATPELAQVPIVALTALAMPGDRERCLEAGANEYLAKPVSLKNLVEIVERLLQQ